MKMHGVRALMACALFATGGFAVATGHPPAPAPTKASNLAASVLTDGLIPLTARGIPIREFIVALNRRGQVVRGETETSAQYDARVAEVSKRPVLGTITTSETLSFVVPVSSDRSDDAAASYTYDADAGKVDVQLTLGEERYLRPDREGELLTHIRPLILEHATLHTDSYVGSNAFGAKVKVARIDRRALGIAIDSPQPGTFGSMSEPDCAKVSANLAPADATKELHSLRVAIFVDLSRPNLDLIDDRDKPTISEPLDIMTHFFLLRGSLKAVALYSGISGKILAQCPVSP